MIRRTGEDVFPLTVSLVEFDGRSPYATPLFRRGTPIPATASITRSTDSDSQTTIYIVLIEGELPDALENHFLSHSVIENIPALSAGQPHVTVSFDVDYNGILSITARERATNALCKVRLMQWSGGLSRNGIENLLNKQICERRDSHPQ